MAHSQQNALQVADASHPVIQQVASAKVAALLDGYLIGTSLTGKLLIADLMAMCTVNPKLLQCTPQSLFQCLVFAAQRKRSFGAYGVWIVPRGLTEEDEAGRKTGPKIVTAIPQLSYQSKNTSARERGAFSIQSEVVVKGERFVVHRERGLITDIDHEIDYETRKQPTQANTVAAWGVVVQGDGKRFFKVLAKHEIDRSHKAAASKAGPWGTDYEAQVRKTLEHRMEEDYVGDFTQYGGGVAAAPPPTLDGKPEGTPGGDLADDLFARAENFKPTVLERAQMMFEVCETPEQVSGLKATEEFKSLWLSASEDDRDAIGAMGQKRYAELVGQAKADAEKDQAGGPPQAGAQGDPPATAQGATSGTPPAGPASPPASSPEPEQEGEQDEQPADAAGEAEGSGAPPEPEPTLGAPPALPAFPPGIQKSIEAAGENPVKPIVRAIQEAWAALAEHPGSVAKLYAAKMAEWGRELDQGPLTAVSAMKREQAKVLAEAGYPAPK